LPTTPANESRAAEGESSQTQRGSGRLGDLGRLVVLVEIGSAVIPVRLQIRVLLVELVVISQNVRRISHRCGGGRRNDGRLNLQIGLEGLGPAGGVRGRSANDRNFQRGQIGGPAQHLGIGARCGRSGDRECNREERRFHGENFRIKRLLTGNGRRSRKPQLHAPRICNNCVSGRATTETCI